MRSVTSRNLAGGFLGGVIGILSSWYVAPAFLPLGVLIGMVLGWWNEDIVHLVHDSHDKAKRTAKKTMTDLVSLTDEAVAALARLCGMSNKAAKAVRWIIAKAIVGSIVAVITSPVTLWRTLVHFSKWLKAHELNQVHTINLTIYLTFVLGLPAIAFFIELHVGITGGNSGLLTITTIIASFGGAMVYRMQHEATKNTDLSELCQYYREWEVISHRGWVGYLFYTIWQHTRYAIGTAVFLTIAVPWFLCLATIGLTGVYPLIGFIAFAQGFYEIATRAGHWLCLGVTMSVTGISWLLYHQNFADPRILWIVALGVGIMSGGLTEVIRRVLLPLYESTNVGQRLKGDDAYGIALGDERGYVETIIFRVGCMWFRQNRLARMFRFICYGFPFARPA